MKGRVLRMLRCPSCSGTLVCHQIKVVHKQLSARMRERITSLGRSQDEYETSVKTGVLACETGCAWYPVINFVPVLLDFSTELHTQFRERYRGTGIAALELPLPGGQSRPGEMLTQQSFTIEWSGLGEDAHTFVFTIEQRERHLRAELDWPQGLLDRPPNQPLLVLDVGAGFGLEPIYIHRATGGETHGAEVIGIDLNLSLLKSGSRITEFPFAHTVIASLFSPPFAPRSFDLVYSNGVIHHTYSTQEAFRSIEKLRTPDGTIYIWVYALEDFFQATWKGKAQYLLERMIRPIFAHLPPFVQNVMLYPLAYRNLLASRRFIGRGAGWTLKNALHDTRDRWTPRYAHRHCFNEVLTWFSQAGLEARLIDPVAVGATLPVPVIGIGVRGQANSTAGVPACGGSNGP